MSDHSQVSQGRFILFTHLGSFLANLVYGWLPCGLNMVTGLESRILMRCKSQSCRLPHCMLEVKTWDHYLPNNTYSKHCPWHQCGIEEPQQPDKVHRLPQLLYPCPRTYQLASKVPSKCTFLPTFPSESQYFLTFTEKCQSPLLRHLVHDLTKSFCFCNCRDFSGMLLPGLNSQKTSIFTLMVSWVAGKVPAKIKAEKPLK